MNQTNQINLLTVFVLSVFKTGQVFRLAALLVVAPSDQHDRVARFVEQRDRRNGGVTWRGILKFLQFWSLGEAEEAFRPFKFRGQGLHPAKESFKVQRTW